MLNRRAFLGSAFAASLANAQEGAIEQPLAPLPERLPPKLPIGYSLYGMQDFAYGDALEIIGRLDYEAVELCLLEDFPTAPDKLGQSDIAQIRSLVEEHDMHVAALMEKILLTADDAEHERNLEKIRRAAQLSHALTLPDSNQPAPLLETVLGGKPDQWEELREPMAERLRDWARVAQQSDIVIAVKAHVGSAAHLPEHLQWLKRRAGSSRIRFTYDYSHFKLQGLDLEGTLRDFGSDAAFIHLKDAAGTPAEPQFLLPGQDAAVDYVDLFRRLFAADYRGSVVVEVSSQLSRRLDYDAIGAAEESLEFLLAARDQALADA